MEQKDKHLYEPSVVQVIEIIPDSTLLQMSGRDGYDPNNTNPFA